MDTKQHRKRLLVLDDERNVAATICMMAGTAEFDAEYACDAGTFLEKVVSWKPTHVMIDLHLGDRNGIEVIHSLVETDCDAGLIIVSGLEGRILESSGMAATERGLNLLGTLAKPFSRKKLHSMLAVEVPTGPRRLDPKKGFMAPYVTEQQLAAALDTEQLIAHFQPKVSCEHGKLVGFECLARWPQPNGGMVPPDSFIALAEQNQPQPPSFREGSRLCLSLSLFLFLASRALRRAAAVAVGRILGLDIGLYGFERRAAAGNDAVGG